MEAPSPTEAAPDEAQLALELRLHLFAGDLLQVPVPEEGMPGFLPEWWTGDLPVLVYPPLAEQGFVEGSQVNLQLTPYHIYFGALRDLAETAEPERSSMLRQSILAWNPDAPLEILETARAHLERDLELALLHYELAMELDENLYEAHQDGGMCEYALANAPGEEREERLSNAETLFRRALELRPDSGLSVWSLARVLTDRGAGEEAQHLMREYLAQFPEADGREMVEQAVREGFEAPDGSDDRQLFQQAQALAFGDDPAAAVGILSELADRHRDEGAVWFVLGAAHRRTGDLAEAERCLRRATRLSPEEPFCWWELGRALMDGSQWRSAEEALRRAVELDGKNPGFLTDLATVLFELGDRDGCREVAEEARALVPDDPVLIDLFRALG